MIQRSLLKLCFSLPWFTIATLVEKVKACYYVEVYCLLFIIII